MTLTGTATVRFQFGTMMQIAQGENQERAIFCADHPVSGRPVSERKP